MTVYRAILKSAWKMSWRNPALWFLGIFAALLTNVGQTGVVYQRLAALPTAGIDILNWREFGSGFFTPAIFSNINAIFETDFFSIVLAALVFLILSFLGLILLWLAVKSQIGLIYSIKKLDEKQKVDLADALKAGGKYFWPVLAINFFVWFSAWIATVIFTPIAVKLAVSDDGFKLALYLLVFMVYFLLNMIIYFVGLYAINFRVLKGKTIGESIKMAFNLFSENWLVSIEMAVILFFVNVLALLALICLTLILAVPFYLMTLIFTFLAAQKLIFFLLFVVIAVIAVLILFTGAWLTTFQMASWTSLFMRLTEGGVVSKLLRMGGVKK